MVMDVATQAIPSKTFRASKLTFCNLVLFGFRKKTHAGGRSVNERKAARVTTSRIALDRICFHLYPCGREADLPGIPSSTIRR